ncbi:hypothetical protein EB077_04855 [bacterium]|nr:hypothetical protein [bacterium]
MNPSQKIDELILSLKDWRGPMLKRIREIFHKADSKIIEDWKIHGQPLKCAPNQSSQMLLGTLQMSGVFVNTSITVSPTCYGRTQAAPHRYQVCQILVS